MEGIAAAKARGVYKGGKARINSNAGRGGREAGTHRSPVRYLKGHRLSFMPVVGMHKGAVGVLPPPSHWRGSLVSDLCGLSPYLAGNDPFWQSISH